MSKFSTALFNYIYLKILIVWIYRFKKILLMISRIKYDLASDRMHNVVLKHQFEIRFVQPLGWQARSGNPLSVLTLGADLIFSEGKRTHDIICPLIYSLLDSGESSGLCIFRVRVWRARCIIPRLMSYHKT